jgi:ATP-binding cassette subfamily F protein uup
MRLVTLQDLHIDFGGPPLLDEVDLGIDSGERIALVGRNGVGKSTLLALLAGRLAVEGGALRVGEGVRIAEMPQEVPPELDGSVRSVIAGGAEALAALLEEHERLAAAGADVDMDALTIVAQRIDAAGGWDLEGRAQRVIDELELPGDARFAELSGGLQRRVLLGRALVTEPDLLLLDEPTNHLDIEAIEWLEGLLRGRRGAVLFTTHDRRFLQRVATRIVELDRGALHDYPGDWDLYLTRREARLDAEARAAAEFDRRLAEEEVWIRQGIKARRTRNEGRVRRLEAMREERRARRGLTGNSSFDVHTASRSGRRVLEAKGVSVRFAGSDTPVIREFSTLIERGDRVGIIGPNGAGKTTLLRLLLGELAPDQGTLATGTRLEIAYFDQHRSALDADARVQDVVADGNEFVELPSGRRHVIGWLQDFLFTPERVRGPVSVLSGGERARLLLARLFAKPSNLLVFDEPTNDLDMETLELLEERLLEYPGTVLLVSHDREFIDRVATSTLVLEGDGRVGEYVGGYTDWVRQRPQANAPGTTTATATAAKSAQQPAASTPPAPKRRKLSYREQRELDALPGTIEALETRIAALQAQLAAPETWAEGAARGTALKLELDALEAEHETAFARWTELDG